MLSLNSGELKWWLCDFTIMNETRIFCSVIIFTIGIYTIIVLQFELYKLNRLTSNHGGADVDLALSEASTLERHPRGCMKVIIAKSPIKIDRLNCGKIFIYLHKKFQTFVAP